MTTKSENETKVQATISRRGLLRSAAIAGAATAITAVAPRARAQTAPVCSGLSAREAYPVSPLILNPFTDPLPIPQPLRPVAPSVVATWANRPGPGVGRQDVDGGTHQLYPGQAGTIAAGMREPIVYRVKLQTAAHAFTSSPVRALVPFRNLAGRRVLAGTVVSRLPPSTVYGFNGTFYSAMVNAEYGKPVLVRFENHLDENPLHLDRGDFGAPELGFLTHLHNGHTAPESDGNPHHKYGGYLPGGWVDDLYLNYPAGGDDAEKMSFLWLHDHYHGHTGAHVYKGMAALYPIYDPGVDDGDERHGLRLPGVRTDNTDGTFSVQYDVPLVLHDLALDDGAVPHQDFHNGCGESRPDQWGKSYFRHFVNHGFVGDVFCVNGKAVPVLEVKRRRYRFRFLGATIARIWELSFMSSALGPRSAVSLGYRGEELQGQYRLPDGRVCMDFAWIGSGGGLLPRASTRTTLEIWSAGRPQAVLDFTRYMDGRPTRKGDIIWLVNTCKMTDGRKPDAMLRTGDADPAYKIPILKIVIGDDAPDDSLMPTANTLLRPLPALPRLDDLPRRTFELQRGGFAGEYQWLINGHPFEHTVPLATVTQGQPEIWTLKNGGGGWTHPMHMHMEEHIVLARDRVPVELTTGREDDNGKDDVVDLDPGEEVEVYRNFRTFTGRYVAHCHQLAHEDHSMMFGWTIAPPRQA